MAGAELAYLDEANLNPEQREAVEATDGPVLALSGAGTGKTKTLTVRIYHLIVSKRAKHYQILAVTFTTKAAGEMRERLAALLDESRVPRWLGTFHSVSYKLLREEPKLAGLRDEFQVADDKKTYRLIRDILKNRGKLPEDLGEGDGDIVKAVAKRIEQFKGWGWPPEEARAEVEKMAGASAAGQDDQDGRDPAGQEEEGECTVAGIEGVGTSPPSISAFDCSAADADVNVVTSLDPMLPFAAEIYPVYQEMLRRENLADFGDLMLWPTLGMEKDEALRRRWAAKFKYILVDEYQDTSVLQLRWLKCLAKGHRNIFCVGDDDQSLYGWRQAEISNILGYDQHFPGAKIVRMVRNYRCPGVIIEAANAVIANNKERLGKDLVATKERGEPITVAECGDAVAEAGFVVRTIERLVADGYRLRDVAVLFRMGFLTRMVEEEMLRMRIPHEVVGQAGFWQREEIRDAVAFLRLVADPRDVAAFERVANKPTRGVGEKNLEKIMAAAAAKSLAPLEAAFELAETGVLRSDAAAGIRHLRSTVEGVRAAATSPAPALASLLELLGYRAWLQKGGEDADDISERLANLDELIFAAGRWHAIADFLGQVAQIEANARAASEDGGADRVQLMTGHRAKGLEFKVVFAIGLEDGIVPSSASVNEGREEEERRWFYVVLTRTEVLCFLSWAAVRRAPMVPSPFLTEIPEGCIRTVTIDAPVPPPTEKQAGFARVIARTLGLQLPDGIDADGKACNAFLDEHADKYRALFKGVASPADMSVGVRIIVAGDVLDAEDPVAEVRQVLEDIHGSTPVGLLIHAGLGSEEGDAATALHAGRTAYVHAVRWAQEKGIECHAFGPRRGKAEGVWGAGFGRHRDMLERGRPHLVVAFPGGHDRAHLVALARQAKVPVMEVGGPPPAPPAIEADGQQHEEEAEDV